jgi:hypothetical protein
MKAFNSFSRIPWHQLRSFAAIVRSPAPVRAAFTGHPVLRAWWKCVLALHGKPVPGVQSVTGHLNCVADGFRFYGWLYRFVALMLVAMAVVAGATDLGGPYWVGFMMAGAACLWCAAWLAFAGAGDLPQRSRDGLWKLVVFLFLVGLFLVSTLMAVSVQAKAVELLPDLANFALTILLLALGVGSYLIELVALVTAQEPLETQGRPLSRHFR